MADPWKRGFLGKIRRYFQGLLFLCLRISHSILLGYIFHQFFPFSLQRYKLLQLYAALRKSGGWLQAVNLLRSSIQSTQLFRVFFPRGEMRMGGLHGGWIDWQYTTTRFTTGHVRQITRALQMACLLFPPNIVNMQPLRMVLAIALSNTRLPILST